MKSRLLAEFLGTASIVAAVLGAGFMVQNLQAEPAVGLFMIASSVAAVLFVAISVFGPYSGAHFNPIVSLALYSLKQFDSKELLSYVAAQLAGAITGAVLANLMFGEVFAISEISRVSTGTFIGEIVAGAGLVLLILQLIQLGKMNLIAPAVALWILAGHLFTSSTSFANPAVTIGRIFSLAPSGIDFYSAAWFVLAQLIGMFIAVAIFTQFRKVKL
jgi:glycerol uptake facilitator-like aquaporin